MKFGARCIVLAIVGAMAPTLILAQSQSVPSNGPPPKPPLCDYNKQQYADRVGVPCSALSEYTPPASQPPSLPIPPAPPSASTLPNDGKSVRRGSEADLTVIRDYAAPLLYPTDVYIDGRKVTRLWDHQYSIIHVNSGPHQIETRWPFFAGQPRYARDVNLSIGDRQYFVIDSSFHFVGGVYPIPGMVASNGLRQIAEREADALIHNCCKEKIIDGSE